MATMYDVQRLCEGSWRAFAEASKDEQHRLAERVLAMLGWTNPDPVATLPFGASVPTVSYLLPTGRPYAFVAHFLAPGLLQPPSVQTNLGLDYCEVARQLVDVTGAMGGSYAFITDLQRSCLYSVDTDELLLHADLPAEFIREFGNVLACEEVQAGSLEEVRRQPRSVVARRLREWGQRWVDSLVQQARLSEEKAQLVLDRLLVLRYLFYHDILNPEEWDLENRVADLLTRALSSQPRGTGRQLRQLFSDLWTDWHADLFEPDAELEEVLQYDQVAAPLLREFALLSQSKFSLPTILESFNYGEAAEKARVRMIPEDHAGRKVLLSRQTLDTVRELKLSLDIDEEGYRSIQFWFDRLVDVYDRLNVEFRVKGRQNGATSALRTIDLLDFGHDAGGRTEMTDRFRYAVENGLTIYYQTPRQYRTSRIILYLHIINCYEESGERFVAFPKFDAALQPRPRMLDSDRQRIYAPQPAVYEEWEVI